MTEASRKYDSDNLNKSEKSGEATPSELERTAQELGDHSSKLPEPEYMFQPKSRLTENFEYLKNSDMPESAEKSKYLIQHGSALTENFEYLKNLGIVGLVENSERPKRRIHPQVRSGSRSRHRITTNPMHDMEDVAAKYWPAGQISGYHRIKK